MKKVIYICIAAIAMIACNNRVNEEAIQQAKQTVVDSVVKVDNARKITEAKRNTVDSMNNVLLAKQQHEKVHTTSREGTSATNTTVIETKQKKGWSSKAKGAVIGAGVGAVTGAMIDKKKGEGAVVGGLIGAGAGLGVGAIIDAKAKKKAKQ